MAMTTEQREAPSGLYYLAHMDTEQLADYAFWLRDRVKTLQIEAQAAEDELRLRFESHADTLPHPRLAIKLAHVTPQYDHQKLRATLGEIVPAEALNGAWIPEEVETKIIPGHFHGTRLNALVTHYGDPVARALEAAKLSGKPAKLNIAPKEATK